MKIFVTIQGEPRKVETNAESHLVVRGACPKCAHEPFCVAGSGRHIGGRDFYVSDAVCLECRERVGEIQVKVETIFGLEEDERMLNGPWRVY